MACYQRVLCSRSSSDGGSGCTAQRSDVPLDGDREIRRLSDSVVFQGFWEQARPLFWKLGRAAESR
jgi:hypothetical protein